MAATLVASVSSVAAQAPAQSPSSSATGTQSTGKSPHRYTKKKPAPAPVVEAPPPPPMPHWPANESPNPASVAWDASGLRITASNSSLQQILHEVSVDTGTKVVGSVPDQRVYGTYGPGEARDVLSQLLQGSGYNILLAGDIGKGAPSEIVLSPRRAGGGNAPNGMNRDVQQPQDSGDDDIPDQADEEPAPQPQVQEPPPGQQSQPGAGFGPNGPLRTPQQVMEEMQQRQLLQQQQMQQQIQQQQQQQNNNPQQ
jgi:hypothetical protein